MNLGIQKAGEGKHSRCEVGDGNILYKCLMLFSLIGARSGDLKALLFSCITYSVF